MRKEKEMILEERKKNIRLLERKLEKKDFKEHLKKNDTSSSFLFFFFLIEGIEYENFFFFLIPNREEGRKSMEFRN